MFGRSFLVFSVAVVLMLSAISLGATYGGGSGMAEDPYQIWTPEQMNTIGLNSADWDKHFKLMDNIDMSAYTGTQYNIIGNATTQFTGTFDGNGHKISNLTYETDEPIYFVGLFGATSKGKAIVTSINEAMIKNLGVENVYINIVGQNEAKSVGGLVGYNAGTITSCYTTGYVYSSSNSVENHVGGLVGKHYGGKMSECYSTCSVTGYMHIGGLVGYNEYGLINNCYTNATVTVPLSLGHFES
jgi:hypothetical protein